MRIYTLQIHNTNGSTDIDEVYSFSDFENLKKEFENKFNYYKNKCEEFISECYPKKDEDDDSVTGSFRFANDDGTLTIGKVYDYDILDED